jgi:hypothetical protein
MFTPVRESDGGRIDSLLFQDGERRIRWDPDSKDELLNINMDEESSGYESNPRNGGFSLSWTPTKINWVFWRYGCGGCGALEVEVPNTSEIMASLRECIVAWQVELRDPLPDSDDE